MSKPDDLLERDSPVYGASAMFHSIKCIELFAEEGLDYVFVDFEHTGPSVWDASHLEEIVRATEHSPIEPVVRVPSGHPETIAGMVRKVLDTGIRYVLAPRISQPEAVQTVVRASKYIYYGDVGQRGIPASRQSRWGDAIDETWVCQEDQSTHVGVMIENQQAVENIRDIVTVPELAFVLIGSMDLSVDMGTPTHTDAGEFHDAIRHVIATCNDATVPVGVLGNYQGSGRDEANTEVHFRHLGSDAGFVRNGLRPFSNELGGKE